MMIGRPGNLLYMREMEALIRGCPPGMPKEMHIVKKPRPLNRFLQAVCIALGVIVCHVATVDPAEAADWRLTPRIGLSGGYDDNITFTKDDKIDSSIVVVQPGLDLDYKTLVSSLRLTSDIDIFSYLDQSDLNRVDQYHRLEGNHRLGQRWDLRGGLRFTRDSTLRTYLEEVGRVVGDVERDYLYASGGVAYDITTVSSITGDYFYETARYEDDIFPDYDRHRIDLRYRHRLKTQQDTISIGPSYYFRTNDLNDTDYLSLDLGWERDWSQITNTFASIGARYANVEDNAGNDDDNWGARARFDLTRQGVASTITFRYFHDLKTTVDGRDINVDNFFLGYSQRLTTRFGAGINGRLVFSYDLFGDKEKVQDSRYYMVEPYIFYRITEHFRSYLRYSYQNNFQELVADDVTRERNRVWVEFTYEWPMML